MANNFLKLQLQNAQNKVRVGYCRLPTLWSELVIAIRNLFPKENAERLRKYWIDEDNDEIDIFDGESYEIFKFKSINRKIYLENIERPMEPDFVPTTQERTNSASNSPEKVIHHGVTCDECEEYPIRGYRYKCMQCDNYDICMKCESKMKHSEHIMIRLAQPSESMLASKRLVRKIRRLVNLTQDEKPHSRRHHRGHGSVFNSFYSMMHDLADADADIPEEQPTASAPPPEPKQTKKRETKQEQKPRCSPTSPRCPFAGGVETPRVEIPIIDIPGVHIDSEYIKAGVQILSNFSEMFAKMLDPMGSDVGDKKDDKNETKNNKDDKSEAPMEEGSTQTPNAETNNPVNEDNTTMEVETQIGNSSQDSGFQDPQPSTSTAVQPKERESLSPEKEKSANMDDKKEGTSDEFDWTLINAPSGSSSLGSVSIVEPSSKSDSANPDYARLKQQLLEHIEKEQEAAASTVSVGPTAPVAPTASASPPPVSVGPTAPLAPTASASPPPVEPRKYQFLYHEEKHINDAIIALMSMGFSNEGEWLTHLLDSVDGNIGQALDLMRPAQ